MREIELSGGVTKVWDYGADAPDPGVIVAVHGFRGDHHGLEPVIARLPNRRVIMPDLPGFGESDAFADRPHDVDGYARWLGELLDALAPATPVTLLGHSFGSIVVSAAVAHGVVQASDLILVNPIGAPALKGPKAVGTAVAVGYYRAARALPERAGNGLLRNRAIVRVMSVAMATTKDRGLRRFIHGQHDAYFSLFANRTSLLESFRASVSHDVSEYAAQISTPTLLIAAAQDQITPLAAERRLAALFPDARLEVLDDVGHLIHYEKPAEAAALIDGFLARRHAEGRA